MINWEDIFEYLYDYGERLYDNDKEISKAIYVSYLTQKTREDVRVSIYQKALAYSC